VSHDAVGEKSCIRELLDHGRILHHALEARFDTLEKRVGRINGFCHTIRWPRCPDAIF
jgi:hypothetical protein